MKMKKLLVALLALTMLATGSIGNAAIANAASTLIVFTENVDLIVKPGETTHFKIPMKAVGSYIPTAAVEAVTATDAPFSIVNLKLTTVSATITSIPNYDGVALEFDIKAKETASINTYPISFKFTCENYDGTEADPISVKTEVKILEEKTPAQLTVSDIVLGNGMLGSETELSFTIKNEGDLTAKNAYVRMNYIDQIAERYTAKNIKIGDLKPGDAVRKTLPITILTTATAGRKTLIADFSFKTVDGAAVTSAYNVVVNLNADENRPELNITDATIKEGLKAGEDFIVTISLKNEGAATAENIKVSVDGSSISKEGILKNYFTDSIWVPNIKKGSKKTVEIPLSVSKYATGGLKDVKVNITYTNAAGVAYTLTNTLYADVVGDSTVAEPNIVVSGVQQSPAQPVAGEAMEVSFYIENKSQVDIKELKVFADGLTGLTFIPVESEPYQYFEKLSAGEKKKIVMPLIVSDSITAGLNNLVIKYTYSGSKTGGDGSVTIPVHDVQNDLGKNSKPKLIISNYVTDTEELRAGKTFNFTFDIYNTHSSIAAKNITVTITQADNVFTPTQGSNSFFIDKIGAGESVQNTIELRVKSDASTKTYPIKITIEYEYAGMEPNPETGAVGETKTVELNLQAVENSRPVVDYVNVNSWDGAVMVGTAATLSFEFYNMGRSALNNVIATVEGDFAKADGNMYFIGNVAEGSSTYAEFDVIPNIEGLAKGTLRITFEDSNGDEVEFIKEFETEIMPAANFDPNMNGGGTGEVFNPEVPVAKAAILPAWLFVIIEIIIFILFIPITRKIIISVYKSKLRKKEQEQY